MASDFGESKEFIEHFEELKASAKHTIIIFLLFFGFFFLISDHILMFMQADLAISLHGLTPFEVLNVRLGMAFMFAAASSVPVILYSLINFAKPGLKTKEYKLLRNSLPISYILFVAGSIFAYQIVFKNAVNFFIRYTQGSGVEIVWGLQNTLMLGLRISILTGILFQLPLIVTILKKAGIVTVKQLKQYRPYVIVAVLLIASIATPPDLLTQILITVPIIILYEISIKIAQYT